MSKLQLPIVTLMCIDCIDVKRAIKVLERCKEKCDFGAVKLLTSIETDYPHEKIMPLETLIAYSVFMLTRVYQYINTDHVLIVQRDGWILNPQAWNQAWLELDYIGPLFVQLDRVGSGGFSLRSKKIMEAVSKVVPDQWNGTNPEAIQKTIPFYEDGMLSLTAFSKDFKIASLEQAAKFSQGGNRNPKYFEDRPFGFHRTWQQIDFNTGRVDSSDLSRDLSKTYDHEIDKL